MAELLLELFSEEIPARMQVGAAEELARLLDQALDPILVTPIETAWGPRRIAAWTQVQGEVEETRSSERGPRITAPEAALAGFLRKHGAHRGSLRQENGYWVLELVRPAVPARQLIAEVMPGLLWRFAWPKSMRWGGASRFTWVRPLRRVLCLLDGAVVPFALREGEDDAHGLESSNLTEGHRFHAPVAIAVESVATWRESLREHRVLVDAAEREHRIAEGIAELAAARGYSVVPDAGLLAEVAGLVEWPVPLLGRIDAGFMDLPPEVMQVSMRVNQRYFALRDAAGAPAPAFAFVANVEARDGGAAIVAGNERVLRARFADARHFWDLDLRTKLRDRVPDLEAITFQAKLGSQGDRMRRLMQLSAVLSDSTDADTQSAQRAAFLAKADLTTGLVAEFPELQGTVGRYYALASQEPEDVARAIEEHHRPRDATDSVPTNPVSITVGLADRLDLLCGFFAIGERPTGSSDPFALRRAALGIVRILRANGLRISLRPILYVALELIENSQLRQQVYGFYELKEKLDQLRGFARDLIDLPHFSGLSVAELGEEILAFMVDRLRVQLRAEGARHDVLAAVFSARADDDINRLLARTDAVTALLGTGDGTNLLTAYRRAANILRIEEKKDGPHTAAPDAALLDTPTEIALAAAMDDVERAIAARLEVEDFTGAMAAMARLRPMLDAFFDQVTVNAEHPALRRNRLRLLNRVRETMNTVADFSKI
ncbi:MAG TPA: glycine--tRNA ligase subunit beta [Acetobacteraceae bacterium]|nr:glycine--tRNA ligase subunit beta [Acetobacteraceae bacterium]